MCNVRKVLSWIYFAIVVLEVQIHGFSYASRSMKIRREADNNSNRKQQKCPKGLFTCKSGQCINEDKKCNGIVDCEDGSDETNSCHSVKCPPFLFRCKYGACIDADKECDGKPDCRDQSDELSQNCKNITLVESCSTNQFRCSSGQCIDEDLKCDGKVDCRDDSDEIPETCWNIHCPKFTYRCKYGACVDGDDECDGKVDCFDGSDEDHCKETGEKGRCMLPNHPENGHWNVFGTQGTFSSQMLVDGGTILQVSCQDGYVLEGSNSLVCMNGSWSAHVGTCTKSLTTSGPPITAGNNGCILPEYPVNGVWSVYKSSTAYQPGMSVVDGAILEIKCDKKYTLNGINSISCMNGEWSSGVGKCLRTCAPRHNTPTLTVNCVFNNVVIPNCTNPVDGTIAKFKCANFYEDPSLDRHPVHVCHDGSWSYQTPQCVPACGVKSVNAETLIINGTTVKPGDYPWQVALYTNVNKEFICGGSLISQRVILSAAHCVTDLQNGKLLSKDNYIVAVGKYYRKYDDNRDKIHVQESTLKQIFLPREYKGPIQNFLGDIAILITEKTFILSLKVRPVCVDWGVNFNIPLHAYGYVTGWGLTSENSNPSEELRELKIPIVTEETCNKNLPEDYNIYMTSDKLCAGYLERGKGVCKGDSGGGLVVKHDGRYYITGIVSLSPQSPTGGCDSHQYALYTRVSEYINFITAKEGLFKTT